MFRLQSVGETDEWYTPPHVFDAFGCRFDLDVASPGTEVVPWIPAERCLTAASLESDWSGFVWMNPPFGGRNALIPWLEKFARHGNGICLVPDRTSAPWWQSYAPWMDAVLFATPKIKFISSDGKSSGTPAQGSCLMALGKQGSEALERATLKGLGCIMIPRRPDIFESAQIDLDLVKRNICFRNHNSTLTSVR